MTITVEIEVTLHGRLRWKKYDNDNFAGSSMTRIAEQDGRNENS